MINSRKIEDLQPGMAEKCRKLLELCQAQGIELLVTSTLRDFASQNALYALGREQPGKIVTGAKAGYSWHNFGLAFDVVPIVNGKAIWNDSSLWNKIGKFGKSLGLIWGGDFKMVDKPHFEWHADTTLADLRNQNKIV